MSSAGLPETHMGHAAAPTVGDWLDAAAPAPPPQLASRLRDAIGAARVRPARETAAVCIASAERLLTELLAHTATGRETALDLLAVDALATYAFEAASADPDSLSPLALDAMRRLAATATART